MPVARLVPLCGLPPEAPREYALRDGTTTLGRLQDQHVQIDSAAHPGLISRRHCTITREDAGGGRQRFLIEDCSMHGVSVDDTPVVKGVRVELHDGAVLGFGRLFAYPVKLVFKADAGTLAEPAPDVREGQPSGGCDARGGDGSVARGGGLVARPSANVPAARPDAPARNPTVTSPLAPGVCAERTPADDGHKEAAAPAPAAATAAAGKRPSEPPAGGRRDADGIVDGWQKRTRVNHHEQAVQLANKRGSGPGSLREEYGAPPFSVFDARTKEWRERREYWEEGYGIESALGRNDNLMGYGGGALAKQNTSVFDPHLCELVYRWFAPPGASVLDPFAGGSVRGCVAARLGLTYHGVELSRLQIAANERQATRIGRECAEAGVPWTAPRWHCEDARNIQAMRTLPPAFDFVFSCPPYYDLEQYSDDARDLSNAQTYAEFLQGYEAAIAAALKRLRRNRFACFVVGEVRDRTTGACLNFVGDTTAIFQRHGACLYNSAVLLTMCNTAPLRARKIFELAKLTPCHQHVLVFFNGDNPNEHIRNIGLVPNQAISWD